jgi:hypothetical protein
MPHELLLRRFRDVAENETRVIHVIGPEYC